MAGGTAGRGCRIAGRHVVTNVLSRYVVQLMRIPGRHGCSQTSQPQRTVSDCTVAAWCESRSSPGDVSSCHTRLHTSRRRVIGQHITSAVSSSRPPSRPGTLQPPTCTLEQARWRVCDRTENPSARSSHTLMPCVAAAPVSTRWGRCVSSHAATLISPSRSGPRETERPTGKGKQASASESVTASNQTNHRLRSTGMRQRVTGTPTTACSVVRTGDRNWPVRRFDLIVISEGHSPSPANLKL